MPPPVVWYFPHVGRASCSAAARASERALVFLPRPLPSFCRLCFVSGIHNSAMPTALTRGQWRETPRALSAQTPTMGTDPPAAVAPSPGRAGRGAAQGLCLFLWPRHRLTRSKRLHEKERGAKRTTTQTNFQHWGGKKHIAPGILTNHPPTTR